MGTGAWQNQATEVHAITVKPRLSGPKGTGLQYPVTRGVHKSKVQHFKHQIVVSMFPRQLWTNLQF